MSVEIAWKQNNLVTDFHLLKLLLVVFGFGSQAFICEFSRQNICSVSIVFKNWINTIWLHNKFFFFNRTTLVHMSERFCGTGVSKPHHNEKVNIFFRDFFQGFLFFCKKTVFAKTMVSLYIMSSANSLLGKFFSSTLEMQFSIFYWVCNSAKKVVGAAMYFYICWNLSPT